MPSTDEKVVQLTLDNKQFNKASDETINSLEKLKKSLEFEGAVDSFDQIEKGVKKVDFKPMTDGVQAVANQFNALHTIADAALRNITNQAITAGGDLIKSLSVDQITSGWDKFSDKTRSVGTLISQGFDMDTVTSQLEKLNWFTDETSYDFTAMVANIAKFTATGRDLEDSVTAMEGIANWAALSGQNAETASRAMYQLSQALGAGTMRLEDYRSIQNASMDTDEFRQKALDAAVALGTLQKVGDDTYKSLVGGGQAFSKAQFATQLTEGAWFTSDVMMQVFHDYSSAVDQIYEYTQENGVLADEAIEALGDQVDAFGLKAFQAAQEARTFEDAIDSVKDAVSTGWMNTFEAIFGDYNEAKELWTDLANTLWDVFAGGIDLRNDALSLWKDIGGRDIFVEGIYDLINNIAENVFILRDAWREVWYGVDADTQLENQANMLLRITQGFKDFADAIKPTEATAKNLKDIFKTLFNTLKSVLAVIKTVGRALSPIFKVLNRITGTALQLLGDLARMINTAMDSIFTESRLQSLYTIINLIANVIAFIAGTGLKGIVALIDNIFDAVGNLWNMIEGYGGGIQGIINVAKAALMDFWNSFMQGETFANTIVDVILGVLGGAIGGIVELGKTFWAILKGEDVDLPESFGNVSDWFKTIGETIVAVDIPGKLQPAIDTLQEFASWMYKFFLDLFNADSGIRYIFSMIKDELLDFWIWAKEGLSQLTVEDVESIALVAALIKIGYEFSMLEKATAGMVKGVGGTFKALTGLVNNFNISNFATSGITGKLETLLNKSKWLQIGIGIAIMINALGQLAKLDRETLINSIITFGLALGMLAAAMKAFEKVNASISKLAEKAKGGTGNFALQILELSVALTFIVQAMKTLEPLMDDPAKYLVTFANIAALVVGMVMVAKTMSKLNTSGMAGAAGGMILMTVALNALLIPIKALSVMELGPMIQGVGGVAVALVALGAAASLMSQANWKSILAAAPAIMALSTAITVLSVVVAALSHAGDLSSGLANIMMIAVGITLVTAALTQFSNGVDVGGIMGINAALISLSAAIGIISLSLKALAACNLGTVSALLWEMIGAISLFTVVAAAAGTVAGPGLMAVSVALLSIGAAAALFGVAISAIAQGIAIISTLTVALGTAGEAAGDEFPSAIQKGLSALKQLIVGFLRMIPELTFEISRAISALIAAVKIGIYGGLPQIVEGVMLIATAVLEVIGRLGEPLLKALIKVIHTLTGYLPTLLAEISLFIDALFVGVGQLVWDALVSAIQMVVEGLGWGWLLGDWIAEAHTEAYKAAKGVTKEVAKGIEENVDDVGKAGEKMGNSLFGGYQKALDPEEPYDKFRYSFGGMLDQATVGVEENEEGFGTLGSRLGSALGTGFVDSATKYIGDFINNLGNVGDYGTDLFQGRGGGFGKDKKYPWKGKHELTESQKNHFQKKTDEIMGVVREEAKEETQEIGEETGNDFANNFAAGATSPASRAKAASAGKETAKTVSDAFKDELEKISRDEESADLLFELWQAQNPSASDAEVTAKKIEYQNQKIALQTQRANIAQQEYMQTLEEYGKDAEETQEAYNKLLQEQIDLLELRNELEEIQKENMKELSDSTDAFRSFGEQIHSLYTMNPDTGRSTGQFLESLGFTKDQINQYAADQVGYNYKSIFDETTDQAKESGKDITTSFVDGLNQGTVANSEAIQQSGQKFVETFDIGAVNTATTLDTGKKVIDIAANGVGSNSEGNQAIDSASQKFVDGFTNGILNKSSNVGNKITDSIANSINSSAIAKINDGTTNYQGIIAFGEKFIEKFEEGTVKPAKNIGSTIIGIIVDSLKNPENTIPIEESVKSLIQGSLASLQDGSTLYIDIINAGKQLPIGLTEGVKDPVPRKALTTSVSDMAMGTYETVIDILSMDPENNQPSTLFFNIGAMIVKGVSEGITQNKLQAIEAAKVMAIEAYEAAAKILQVESPSKKMYEIGMYFDEGMANGIRDYGNEVTSSVIGMSKVLVDNANRELTRTVAQTSLQKIFGLDDDQLGLSVVVDADTTLASNKMSELDRAYSLASGFSSTALETGGIMQQYDSNVTLDQDRIENLVQAVVSAETYQSETLQNIYDSLITRQQRDFGSEYKKSYKEGTDGGQLIEKVEFTQNNYSPKTISRVETYRNTKRQLDTFAQKFGISKR